MIEANLPANLSLEEVSKIISDARATSTDPFSMGMRIFGALADNATVSGDTLRQALSLSAITLEGSVSLLANAIEEVSKTGNLIKISNAGNAEFTVANTKLRVLSQVTCLVGDEQNLPVLTKITGISVHELLWLGIQSVQLKNSGQQMVLHVVTSAGSRDIPVAL